MEKLGKEKFSSELTDLFSDFDVSKLLDYSKKQSVSKINYTKELVDKVRLNEEMKGQLYDLTFMNYALKNSVPESTNDQTDSLLKGIISGVIFGMLVPFLDVILSVDLGQFTFFPAFFGAILFVVGYFYLVNGIYGVMKIRKLEKKIKDLQKETILEEIRDIILTIIED